MEILGLKLKEMTFLETRISSNPSFPQEGTPCICLSGLSKLTRWKRHSAATADIVHLHLQCQNNRSLHPPFLVPLISLCGAYCASYPSSCLPLSQMGTGHNTQRFLPNIITFASHRYQEQLVICM